MLLLTSVDRVKNALGITTSSEDGLLSRLISTTSIRFAYYLKREDALELKARSEYISPYRGMRQFFLRAYPIVSVASLASDPFGAFTGNETIVPATNYLVNENLREVNLISWPVYYNDGGMLTGAAYPEDLQPGGVRPRSIRVNYTGGLAASGTVSTWTKTMDTGGTVTVGNYIVGQSSGAVAKITAQASGTISYSNIYGIFTAENVVEYTALDNSLSQSLGPNNATGVNTNLLVATSVSLAELYPDLVEAAEMNVRYLRTNRTNFENIVSTINGDTRISRSDMKKDYSFLPEVRDILQTYMNNQIV